MPRKTIFTGSKPKRKSSGRTSFTAGRARAQQPLTKVGRTVRRKKQKY